MLEMNIKYNSHNSVLLPFWGILLKMPLISGDRYFQLGMKKFFIRIL